MERLKRKVDEYLVNWKNKEDKKPLIIKGARQIGKTNAIRNFGEKNYKNFVEINFALNEEYKDIFENGFNVDTIIRNITYKNGNLKFIPNETLIFFDEMQEYPSTATSLKAFNEDGRYDVICSGSLMGINYKEIESNSVGNKIDYIMRSMDFEEFLWAVKREFLAAEIRRCFEQMASMPEGLHAEAMEYYRQYLIVGGMPAVINRYLETERLLDVTEVQSEIVDNYIADMAKYAANTDSVKIRACYNSIPAQLAKENKKFQYKVVQKGGTTALFGVSIEWLNLAGVCDQMPENRAWI